MSGIEEKVKNCKPTIGEELGHMTDQNNNNKKSPENDRKIVAFYKWEKKEKNEKKDKLSVAMFSILSNSSSTSPASETSLPNKNASMGD